MYASTCRKRWIICSRLKRFAVPRGNTQNYGGLCGIRRDYGYAASLSHTGTLSLDAGSRSRRRSQFVENMNDRPLSLDHDEPPVTETRSTPFAYGVTPPEALIDVPKHPTVAVVLSSKP